MKTMDFVNQAVGSMVYIAPDGDMMVRGDLKMFIHNKTPLKLDRITKGGMCVVIDNKGEEYQVRPKNIREVGT